MSELEFKSVDKGERSRTYIFSDGKFRVENVVRVYVSPRGTHRLETVAGQKLIVRCGWHAIEIEADEWSF